MGIPTFYKWLVERYPKCVVNAVEDRLVFVHGVRVPVDVTGPNPNGIEYDNLYLDMNGIIHPCFHPVGLPAPTTYDEVFEKMFKYIDKIFSIVRPRKLLFMAIDGVAPRAKMNQQRARRFKAAREAAEAAEGTTLESEEGKPDSLEQPEMDSNVITPGTEFMELLSSALRYYIHLRMNEDSGWKGIKVILSDATVPGEGEYKVMSFIRLQRNLPGYDPNTWHCMYGLDADLIMLALATHEINFSILREDGPRNKQHRKSGRRLINQKRRSGDLEDIPKPSELLDSYILKLKFQFLNIWVLREYLRHDMEIPDQAVKGDLERFVDDFVFMCLFVGNDFLPQIPSLEISEGAINLLLMIYKDEFVKRGGYLTNSFEVNLKRVEHFLHSIGAFEKTIIRQRTRTKSKKGKRSSKSRKVRCNGSRFPSRTMGKENPSIRCTSSGRKFKLKFLNWKDRFYVEKFEPKTTSDCKRIKKDAAFKYVEGICWVMRYYYQEVCSWQWFYPYHYAPFASDFANIDQLEIQFTLGEPFKPFDQLLGVLPAARCTSSAHALPMAYRKLMTDSSSPILDFYPTDFEVDMEGKRFAWQAVIKLPFIDESRLLSEIAKVEHTLTDEDRKRNTPGLDVLFVHVSHPLAAEINSICEQAKDTSKLTDTVIKQKIDPALSGGMNGYIYISDKPMRPAEICSPIADLKMIAQNDVISVFYKYPAFHSHIPRLPDGVMLPEKIVGKDDLRPLYKIWCSKGAHLLYARKTQAIWNIIYSRRNKPMTYLGSYKQQVVQHNEAGYTLRRQLVVNRGTKEKANIVLNCHVKKLENCDLQKQRKGDGESIPEDALLRLNGKDKSSEGDQVPCEDNNGNCAVGLKETGREVKHGKVEGVSFSVENFEKYGGEQTDGGAANKTIDAVESKRRKPRSIRRKHSDDVTHSNGEKIGNFENIEQSNSDGNNGPVADGPEEKIVDIKDNELNGVLCNDRRSEGIDARKTEVGLHADSKNDELEYKNRGELERGQKNNEGGQPESVIKLEQTEVDKSKDGMDMETEVRSNKRKKQKSRKRKHSADIGQNNDENLKRFFVKEPIENDGGDGVHKDAFKMESSINREQPEEVALLAAPAGIGEVKTEVKSKKNRKRSRKKKDSNSEEQCTVGHNTGASGVVVLKGVKSSEEDQVPCEDNNSNCPAGLKEADREVKHGKVEGVSFSVENFEKYVGEQTDVGAANKTINIEIKHSELNGVLVNDSRSEGIDARKIEVGLHADIKNDEVDYKNHGELEMGQKKNEGSRPGSFIKWEQTEVDKSADGVEMEMEMEVRSKKRKRQRSKKRKHSADIGQNNDENLKTFFVKEPVENDCGDGVQKDAFKMEGSINREQPEEVGLHAAPAGIGEVKTEVKSKKNRKRSKKRKDSNSEALSCNNDGELNSCSNREQCTVVGHNTGASGVVVLKGGVKSSEEDQVPCEDNNGNCAEGLKEADREVKHDKVEGVSFSVENFEKYVGEQTDVGAANKTINVEIKDSELNGVLVNDSRSEGIDARKPEVGLHADIKNDEVKYKSRGELEMGQKKNEGGRPGSFIKWEQTEVDKRRDGVEMETEVRSKKRKRQRSKKRKHIADIRQNNDENLKTFFVKEPVENDCGDGVHKDAFKMEGGINREQPEEVGLHAASAGIGEVKTEVKSKKNRKRSKKRKDSNSEALSCNNDGEFKSCSNREQCTVVGHNTGASGVVVLKGGVKSSEEDQVPCEDNNGNCAEGLKEADREVKHDKVEGVSFSVENFEKYVGEQTDVGAVNKKINIEIKHSELNGVLVNDSRSEGIARKTEVGLHADIKNDEVEYKSRGELEMGQKKNEGGRPGSFIKWEQTEVDKSRDGVEMQTEVRSKKRRR